MLFFASATCVGPASQQDFANGGACKPAASIFASNAAGSYRVVCAAAPPPSATPVVLVPAPSTLPANSTNATAPPAASGAASSGLALGALAALVAATMA